jgi:hypothetical protein
VLKSTIVLVVTSCSSVAVHWRFGETYDFQLQGQRVNQVKSTTRRCWFLAWFTRGTWKWRRWFLLKPQWTSTELYRNAIHKMVLSIVTTVRISNTEFRLLKLTYYWKQRTGSYIRFQGKSNLVSNGTVNCNLSNESIILTHQQTFCSFYFLRTTNVIKEQTHQLCESWAGHSFFRWNRHNRPIHCRLFIKQERNSQPVAYRTLWCRSW